MGVYSYESFKGGGYGFRGTFSTHVESRNAYFVHQYRCSRRQRDKVGGEEGEMEAGRVEELEGGGQEEIEDNLSQDQGQQYSNLVQSCPVH